MPRQQSRFLLVLLSLLLVPLLAAPASAAHKPVATIQLPDGWRGEGVEIGEHGAIKGKVFVGSIPTGAIWRGDVRTGKGSVLVPGATGKAAIGLELDRHGRLWVAGGPTGKGWVYDARTGRELASYTLTTSAVTFVNDVVVTRSAAYFTDSSNQRLYKVKLGRKGRLPGQGGVGTVPLTGDIVYGEGINANGIEAARHGRVLVLVQSNTGLLFTVNPRTGVTRKIDLGAESVPNGDGLLLEGRTLLVVQNQLNLIAKVRLDRNLCGGTVQRRISDPDLDVPSTIADYKGRIYANNARFSTPPTPETEYSVVLVDGR
jgi:sugar lactone lactonase YvrE